MSPANLEKDLRAETEKWMSKADEAVRNAVFDGDRGAKFMANVNAYISDSKHFLEKGDLIRAFEAVVWAWAWLEIGEEMGIIRK